MKPWVGPVWFVVAACALPAPSLPNLDRASAFADEVDTENLMRDVERLATDHETDVKLSCEGFEAMDRYPSCELSRDAAVELVRERFEGLGLTTELLVLGEPPHAAHNVIAELRGTTRAHEVVMIVAHVDAFYAGADDNSSAVAAMLEIARLASQRRFARTLRFAGFDLEERGSLGSLRYTNAGLADDVVAALVLECIGFASTTPKSQDSPPGLPLGEVGDSLVIVGNGDSAELVQRVLAINHSLMLMPARGIIAGGDGAYPLTGALTRSDNGPLWLRGIPAVLLTDTANYRNDHYHRASDTPETLDPEFLAASTRLTAASLAVLGDLQP